MMKETVPYPHLETDAEVLLAMAEEAPPASQGFVKKPIKIWHMHMAGRLLTALTNGRWLNALDLQWSEKVPAK